MTIATKIKGALEKIGAKKPLADAPERVFEVRETSLCAKMRVSKDDLRLRRQYFLTQGQHWDYVNKRVLLSTIGAQILLGTIGVTIPPEFAKNAPAEDSGAPRGAIKPAGLLMEKNPPPVAFTGQLIAWAMPSHNHHILVAYLPGTDPTNPMNLVSCYVRSNLNFIRGMVLPGPGRRVNQLPDACAMRYELLGACPRRRGTW